MYSLQIISILLIALELHAVAGKKITNSAETPGNISPNPVVQTSKGAVRGTVILTDRGNWGLSFQRIPYAAPPTGANRFKPPWPVEPWAGTLDGTDYGPCCWQLYSLFDEQRNRTSSEDCLTLNVYAPLRTEKKLESDNGYPVVLYYIGGAWQNNDPARYPIEPLIDNYGSRGVIMIMIGYRVNIFGGFTNGKEDFPGNGALRDYIAGLKWIQQEIRAFGGDPNRVTIQGESSGGQGVSLISLSPAAEGLFQNVIPMSGSAATTGAVQRGAEIPASGDFATLLGCNNHSEWDWAQDKAIKCVQNIEPKKLLLAFILSGRTEAQSPRIDGPGGILPDDPITMLSRRRPYPLLTGTLTKEAVFFLGVGGAPLDDTIAMFTSVMAEMLCEQLGNTSYTGEDRGGGKVIGDACKKNYKLAELKLQHPDTDHLFWFEMVIDIIDANAFFAPSFLEADFMRKTRSYPVYLYSFEYVKKGSENLAPWHGLDLWHLLGFPLPVNGSDLSFKTAEDSRIDDIYATVFCNFAKYGNPTPPGQIDTIRNGNSSDILPTWAPLASPTGYNYYSIDLEPKNKLFYHYSDLIFWNQIVPQLSESIQQHTPKGGGRRDRQRNKTPKTSGSFSELEQDVRSRTPLNEISVNLDTLLNVEQGLMWESDQKFTIQRDTSSKLKRLEAISNQMMKQLNDDPKLKTFVKITSQKLRESLTNDETSIGLTEQRMLNVQSLNAMTDSKTTSSTSTSSSLLIGTIAIIAIVAVVSLAGMMFAVAGLNHRRKHVEIDSQYGENTELLTKIPGSHSRSDYDEL